MHAPERDAAIRSILSRNPSAFDAKFRPVNPPAVVVLRSGPEETVDNDVEKKTNNSDVKGAIRAEVSHRLGCKCRKSACLKKYCECFHADVKCGSSCQCTGCRNKSSEDTPPDSNAQSTTKGVSCLLMAAVAMTELKPKETESLPPDTPKSELKNNHYDGSLSSNIVPASSPVTAVPVTPSEGGFSEITTPNQQYRHNNKHGHTYDHDQHQLVKRVKIEVTDVQRPPLLRRVRTMSDANENFVTPSSSSCTKNDRKDEWKGRIMDVEGKALTSDLESVGIITKSPSVAKV